MAFKKIVRNKAFWRSVAGMAIAFAIVYHIITMLFEFGGFYFSAFFDEKIGGGRWVRFVLGTILSSFLYGFIVSYGLFVARIKKEEREQL
ncbi:MAG TPA: hypothetical protein VFD29_08230 [Gillisia sp.]|nr:hypothetical protein [Gillisia sp.]